MRPYLFLQGDIFPKLLCPDPFQTVIFSPHQLIRFLLWFPSQISHNELHPSFEITSSLLFQKWEGTSFLPSTEGLKVTSLPEELTYG